VTGDLLGGGGGGRGRMNGVGGMWIVGWMVKAWFGQAGTHISLSAAIK
jgi:hypothetical protein